MAKALEMWMDLIEETEMSENADDFDRKWSEAQDGGMGEHPPLDSSSFSDNFNRSELGSDWTLSEFKRERLSHFPTVLVPPTPNGLITVLLSCRCGATASTALELVDGDLGGTMYDFNLPDGWYLSMDRGGATSVVRCPLHRQIV